MKSRWLTFGIILSAWALGWLHGSLHNTIPTWAFVLSMGLAGSGWMQYAIFVERK